jgi:uncharacterized protein
MERETRALRGAELRAADGHKISGYAAVFDEPTEIAGMFTEIIRPEAFSRALREKQDVRCLLNHDPSILLGRTKSGTLELAEKAQGLWFDCQFPKGARSDEIYESVKRHDVDGSSFSFYIREQRWTDEKGADGVKRLKRELLDVDLLDVGPVTWPAYPQTSVSARSWPEGVPSEIRSRIAEPEKSNTPRQELRMIAGLCALRQIDIDAEYVRVTRSTDIFQVEENSVRRGGLRSAGKTRGHLPADARIELDIGASPRALDEESLLIGADELLILACGHHNSLLYLGGRRGRSQARQPFSKRSRGWSRRGQCIIAIV